jgi:hypothetical protein
MKSEALARTGIAADDPVGKLLADMTPLSPRWAASRRA